MSRIGMSLLREAIPGERITLLPDLNVGGFTLRNSAVKWTRDTGAPVYLFDVMDGAGERVGIASLVREKSSQTVRDFGHVCVTLADRLSAAPLLAEIAKTVFEAAYKNGLTELRLVVPHDHSPSIEACKILQPTGEAEILKVEDRQFLAFRYLRHVV